MTKTLIGIDSEGVACVKITKGTINPVTEPDANYGSFYYNSKWAKDVKIHKISKWDTPPHNAVTRYPSGASTTSYTWAEDGRDPTDTGRYGTTVVIRNSYFPDLPYDIPLYDVKTRRISDGRFIEQTRLRQTSAEDNLGREAGFYRMPVQGTWYKNKAVYSVGSDSATNSPFGTPGNCLYVNPADGTEKIVVIWSAPGENESMKDSAVKAPVSGQRSVEITSDYCRVAKPGYDVRTATPTQLAFDSSRRPASVIKSGDISLPLGTTSFELGFTVTANMVCDMILYEDEIVFPMSKYNSALVCEYAFSGTKLNIYNTSKACRCRFIVLAFDDLGSTNGTNNVLRQFTTGGVDVVQFLRPGSASSPRFTDIVLDSRWPSLQILAEGFRTIATAGNRNPLSNPNDGDTFTVNFTSSGLFPFVKMLCLHQGPEGIIGRAPHVDVIESYNNSDRYISGDSAVCKISGGTATFYTYAGNPTSERSPNNVWTYDYSAYPLIGIHYYILGIAI